MELFAAWDGMMSRHRTTIAIVFLGLSYQVIVVWINYIVARDVGIIVTCFDWCWILGAVSIALLLPITIAGIGVRESAYVGLLSLLGVSIEKAVAVSFLVFGISVLGGLVGAMVEFGALMRVREHSV
jgi:uncharacterized membrane protein YbhN (UPF0104 family)